MLNAAQIAARTGKLGSSDMGKLMGGNAQDIHNLWLEKTLQKIPDDLSDVWSVQLGNATEPLNLYWYERTHRQPVSRKGDIVTHFRYDWAICTLDGWIDELRCPIECKHTGGREPFDPVIIERYQPQCQWQMEVTGSEQVALSVIMGTAEPIVEFIQRDADYAGLMLERGAMFIKHVRHKTPPVELPAIPAPIDATAIVDMHGNNEFANQASIWLDLRDSAAAYDDAAKILKSMVPPDAKRCFGYGVQITRNRLGNLSLREMRE